MFQLAVLAIAGVGVVGALDVAIKRYHEAKEKREMPSTHDAKQSAKKNKREKNHSVQWASKGKEALEKKIVPLFLNAEKQELPELSPVVNAEQKETSEAESEINHYLAISSISLGLATAGTLFYPPLTILSTLGLIYGSRPVLQFCIEAIREGKIGAAIVDAISLPAIILTGYHVVASLAYTLYYLMQKFLLKVKENSTESLVDIFGEQPRFVWLLKDGVEIEIPFDELKIGDQVVINAGQTIPVDGRITHGIASIDQRTLTGEAQPVEKEAGEQVFASTVVLSGKIRIQVEKAGSETVAAKIRDILNHTTDFKTGVQLKGEQIADNAALPTLALAALALQSLGFIPALALLNSFVGDPIRVVAPISVLNFLQMASSEGILIKDGRALELLNEVDTIVFDKTGTLTQEQPHVAAIYSCHEMNENQLLAYAAAAEYKQTHPIAMAILQEAHERSLSLLEIEEAQYEIGYGLKVRLKQKVVLVGSQRFMQMSKITIPSEINAIQQECNEHGYSLVYVALDGQLAGAIELHATIRPEAKEIISELRQRGLAMYIISGDHEKPTQKLAQELGIEHYFAETLPENKANLIEQLQKDGKTVCFIGDGINDSIALKTANVSISLRGASTIATDTASIILMDGSLKQLVRLIDLAKSLDYNMKSNLVVSVLPGLLTIGGVFFLHFRIVSALMLYSVGLVAGVANAMQPMITYQRKSQTDLEDAHPVDPAFDERPVKSKSAIS